MKTFAGFVLSFFLAASAFGQSFDFNGSTSFIDCCSAALDDVGGSPGSKSVCAWVFLDTFGESDTGWIFNKGSAVSSGWFFNLENRGGTLPTGSFALTIGGATSGRAYGASGTLSLNKWWFLCGTYTPSDGGPRLWIGDVSTPMAEVSSYSADSGATRRDVTTYGSDAGLGGGIGNRLAADRTFDGRIAHVTLWDNLLQLKHMEFLRIKPSRAAQVKFSTSGGTAIALKAYWPLNGSDGDTAFDHSGNGNTSSGAGVQFCTLAEGPPYR